MAQQPLVGQGLLIIEASRSHSDTPHSVRLLWTSDRTVAETSTWQHTTITRDTHPCPSWDSNQQSQQANGRRDPRRRPRGHWDRLLYKLSTQNSNILELYVGHRNKGIGLQLPAGLKDFLPCKIQDPVSFLISTEGTFSWCKAARTVGCPLTSI